MKTLWKLLRARNVSWRDAHLYGYPGLAVSFDEPWKALRALWTVLRDTRCPPGPIVFYVYAVNHRSFSTGYFGCLTVRPA